MADDGDTSIVHNATEAALERAEEWVANHGARVIAGFACILVDGLTPNGGMHFHADEDDGPTDPEDMLAFLLNATEAFAKQHGLAFAVMRSDAVGGQG